MHYLPLPHPRKSSDASLQQSDQKTDQVTLLDLARAPHPQSLGLGIELGDVEIPPLRQSILVITNTNF